MNAPDEIWDFAINTHLFNVFDGSVAKCTSRKETPRVEFQAQEVNHLLKLYRRIVVFDEHEMIWIDFSDKCRIPRQ